MFGEATASAPDEGPIGRGFAQFWGPRYWPTWVLFAWMQLTARVLPFAFALSLHERIGALLQRIPTRTRVVVRRNLELAFPDLSAEERLRLERRHFRAIGATFAEAAIAWCAPDRRLEGRFRVTGADNLTRALAQGRGVILYVGHFTPLEICGRKIKQLVPNFACMFSRRSNAMIEEIQRRGRMRCAHESIAADQVRAMLASLRRNAVVWYAPDQVPHGNSSALLPFFAEPAMMNTATTALARISGSAVVPMSYRRRGSRDDYELRIHAPLEGFPSDDAVADTRRLNEILEGFVRECPEQYFWVHKKFRGRPGLPDPYGRKVAPRDRAGPAIHPVSGHGPES